MNEAENNQTETVIDFRYLWLKLQRLLKKTKTFVGVFFAFKLLLTYLLTIVNKGKVIHV